MPGLDLKQIEEMHVIKYILLLPEMNNFGRKDRNKDSVYYLINSMWCEPGSDMIWKRPKLLDCVFHKNT